MKLIDLQEIFEPSTQQVKTNRVFRPSNYPKSTKNEISRGYYSIVSNDPSDPHLVKKRQRVSYNTPINPDAFVLYANYVMDHKLWDNIHFPRIYSTKTIEDREGTTAHKWKIEKLEHLSSLDKDEFNYLKKRSFSDEISGMIRNSDDFGTAIEDVIRYNNKIDQVRDESLRDALQTLSKMRDEFRTHTAVGLDIHGENIMVRRTSTGIQLVITDPFA